MERLWILLGAVFAALLTLAAGVALAHQAPSGWDYDPECCSQQDCSVATNIEYLSSGDMKITTVHGTDVYPANFPRRASKDDKVHACHLNGKKYCLYWPPEV